MTEGFAVRGFMLDVSRDRVPTRVTLEFLVDLLARCGYNQLELYMEHTFAHAGHETVWRDASPLTADDLRWLDALCRDRGIALVPNRNCLGHMDRWLKHPEYLWRAENPDGFDAWGKHWPPHTFAPTDENYELVSELLEELAAATTAEAINIGMDEPIELGLGAGRDLVQREGKGKAYTDWVLRVAEPWLDRGYRVEMWGDILSEHPDQAVRLPDGIDLIMWCYDSPEVIRRAAARDGWTYPEPAGFGGLLAPFTDRGQHLWVSPGTGVWHSVTGRLDCAVANIADAAREGRAAGCGGFLLTSWGDTGHWEGYSHCLVPIIAGGLAASSPETAARLVDRSVLQREVGRVLFDDEAHPGAELLVRVGWLGSLLDHPIGNENLLFHALFDWKPLVDLPADTLAAAAQESADLQRLCADLPPVAWVEEIRTSLQLADIALARLSGRQVEIPAEVVAQVRRNWLATSAPGGLDDSLAKASGIDLAAGAALPTNTSDPWSGLCGRQDPEGVWSGAGAVVPRMTNSVLNTTRS